MALSVYKLHFVSRVDGFDIQPLGCRSCHQSPPFCSTNLPSWRTKQDGRQGPTGRKAGLTVDFNLLRDWIEECNESHPQCQPSAIIPLKLINCETRCIDQLRFRVPYCALSYPWGKTRPYDEEHRVDTALPSSLPPNIKDAITSALNLGVSVLSLFGSIGTV
jgi:hypothetical protein